MLLIPLEHSVRRLLPLPDVTFMTSPIAVSYPAPRQQPRCDLAIPWQMPRHSCTRHQNRNRIQAQITGWSENARQPAPDQPAAGLGGGVEYVIPSRGQLLFLVDFLSASIELCACSSRSSSAPESTVGSSELLCTCHAFQCTYHFALLATEYWPGVF
jgi:hypothetical protein